MMDPLEWLASKQEKCFQVFFGGLLAKKTNRRWWSVVSRQKFSGCEILFRLGAPRIENGSVERFHHERS